MLYKKTCEPRKKYRDLKELCEQNLCWDSKNTVYIKKENFKNLKKTFQKEESELTRNKPLVLFVLGVLVLLSLAALTRSEEISHSLEEVRKNSIQQLLVPHR